mmetsp:Transcript_32838/g.94969  ORF Transcript_32838/g.94969 Transcript_32838/m.94969 type:complete len:205 (+) Transcript_32838:398-1012(+)
MGDDDECPILLEDPVYFLQCPTSLSSAIRLAQERIEGCFVDRCIHASIRNPSSCIPGRKISEIHLKVSENFAKVTRGVLLLHLADEDRAEVQACHIGVAIQSHVLPHPRVSTAELQHYVILGDVATDEAPQHAVPVVPLEWLRFFSVKVIPEALGTIICHCSWCSGVQGFSDSIPCCHGRCARGHGQGALLHILLTRHRARASA